MLNRKRLIEEFYAIRKAQRELAKRRLSQFAIFVDEKYETEWFHKEVMKYLDKWRNKEIRKLAIFIPPQHGKSDMSSIKTPAKILGDEPTAKIVVASYSDSNSSKFCRSTQDTIDSHAFKELYPNVKLPAKGVESTNELRNNTYFETIGYKGYYKAVSIGGSLTGFAIDYGIIDDPIKDRQQANSETYRNRLWDWYNTVWRTRLHNDSCELMLFTRWHTDDLAGRMFDPKNKHYNEQEAKEWTILVIPAIKEQSIAIQGQIEINDPRAIGEALWPKKHSVEKLKRAKEISPLDHASLNQQRPVAEGGNILKEEWFKVMQESQVPFNTRTARYKWWIDGAFTEDSKNDESGIMKTVLHQGILYVFNFVGVRKELNEFLQFAKQYFIQDGYTAISTINIELKASGHGFYSMMKQEQYGAYNVVKVNNKIVSYGKLTRAQNIQPSLASGKVVLIQGAWNKQVIEQCTSFPNGQHDEALDLLCYAIHDAFIQQPEIEIEYE